MTAGNTVIASPTLWFNLGNARFKAGEIGHAVAAYRRAEALSPRDPDVRFNLQFARKHALGTDFPAAPRVERMLASLSLNEWTLLTATGVWSLFGLLAVGQWRAEWRRHTRGWLVGAGLIDPDGPQARRPDAEIARDVDTVRRAAVECGFV